MITARTIGLGLGLMLFVGVGAATFSRAQQPGGKTPHQTPTRAELRERILKLWTEVDFLQLEYDAARAALLDAMKHANDGADSELAAIRSQIVAEMSAEPAKTKKEIDKLVKLFGALKKARETKNKPELAAIGAQIRIQYSEEQAEKWTKLLDSPASDNRVEEELKAVEEQLKLFQVFLNGGQEAEAATDRIVQLSAPQELKTRLESSRGEIDRRKQEFARKSRSLHDKKLDLAEAEKQYQNEAR